jgi:hypothetical protein
MKRIRKTENKGTAVAPPATTPSPKAANPLCAFAGAAFTIINGEIRAILEKKNQTPDLEFLREIVGCRASESRRLQELGTEAFRYCIIKGIDMDRAQGRIGRLTSACQALQDFGMRDYWGSPKGRSSQEDALKCFAELILEFQEAVYDIAC